MLSRYEQFSSVISSIYRAIQKIEREEMIQYGFKGAYAQYLAAMNRHPQGVTAAQLSDICDKDKAAISRVVMEMEEKGLVTRRGENHYRAQICLTEAGRQAALFVSRRAQEAVEAAGKGLTDPQRVVFYSALDLIAGNLQTISREGIPASKQQTGEETNERKDSD